MIQLINDPSGRVVVMIDGAQYDECCTNAANMASSKKRGAYGGGILNTTGDPLKTERSGQLGEAAFAAWAGVPYVWEYKSNGDGGIDYTIAGKTLDVKTANSDYGANLIIKDDLDKHREFPLICDAYVCAVITSDDREERAAVVELVGFVTRRSILEHPVIEQSRKGNWMNYRLDHESVSPMSKLKHDLDFFAERLVTA